jgi:RNA polymerase sigma-70 factor (ECF subfamily)
MKRPHPDIGFWSTDSSQASGSPPQPHADRLREQDARTRNPTELEAEFLELLARHKYELFNLIFCIIPSLADAEDVFQQTTLAIWDNFSQFQPGTDFMAWAGQVARYRAWNFARSKRRERVYFSEELISELAEAPFESTEIQEARLQALARCRQKLSAADQNLILLCYGGSTVSQAAVKLGRPVRAVHNSLSRVRRALYECIERALARGERA